MVTWTKTISVRCRKSNNNKKAAQDNVSNCKILDIILTVQLLQNVYIIGIRRSLCCHQHVLTSLTFTFFIHLIHTRLQAQPDAMNGCNMNFFKQKLYLGVKITFQHFSFSNSLLSSLTPVLLRRPYTYVLNTHIRSVRVEFQLRLRYHQCRSA